MQRNYGPDVENPPQYQTRRAAELNKNPEFVQYMRKLDRIAHRRVAERLGGVYQQGGRVDDVVPRNIMGYPQPAPREPLRIPIGRGELALNPEYQPERHLGGYGRYELPIGDEGLSVGVQGHVDRYIGPGYEQVPVQGGGGFFIRKKFQQGGRVDNDIWGSRKPPLTEWDIPGAMHRIAKGHPS
jgi:hypothetical protein